MGKIYEVISTELTTWVQQQPVFFVATAPLSDDGHVNCSPKGLDTLRVLNSTEVAYLDLTGSGAETIAHVRENGRIVLMFCALSGAPKIVRFHGRGEVVLEGSSEWAELSAMFPKYLGARSIVRVKVSRVSDSCGYGVPKLEFTGERDALTRWAETRGEQNLPKYRAENNARSIDGLPGLDPP